MLRKFRVTNHRATDEANHNRGTMNEQRRMFRGRGGPTDRRLPKHNARRRKIPREERPPKYDGPKENRQEQVHVSDLDESGESMEAESISSGCEIIGTLAVDDEKKDASVEVMVDPSVQEIQHLMSRIRNNRTTFTMSKIGLGDFHAYEINVLNATRNCVKEFRSILSNYNNLDDGITREMGQAIFELIQQALQTGPLQGAKPGYFKRCGSELAAKVSSFIQDIASSKEEAIYLHMTEKQADAVMKWRENAEKAAHSKEGPSKSIISKQDEALKKRARKKK